MGAPGAGTVQELQTDQALQLIQDSGIVQGAKRHIRWVVWWCKSFDGCNTVVGQPILCGGVGLAPILG